MTTDTMALVRAYHDAWTSKNFDDAIALLSPALQVEVPINDYPTTESFGQALVRTGGMTARVNVLSAMSAENEAMILYDMDVEKVGRLRVVEHFTVADGKIVRLRQIHDTAAVGAAGMGT
jgi:ketosteroid isomerase-like protein